MDEQVKSVSWEAYEHHHTEKGSDWFWVLGIVTIAVTVAAILLGNVLFGILIFVAGAVTALQANREPAIVEHSVTSRGVQLDDKMYPYSTLDVFYIDEEDPLGPQLLIRSQKLFMPLLIMPLPEESVDDIEELIASRLPEEFLEEPFANKLMEFFGF